MLDYQPSKTLRILHVNAEVTRACNLRCDYCFNDSGKRGFDELALGDWRRAINVAQSHGARSALFTGGEVMTRRDAPQIIEYSLEKGLQTSILSNGLRLDQQYRDMLQALRRVQISLDSASSYVHDARRGQGSWQVARQAIDYVRGLDVPVEISTTISEDRLDELEGVVGVAYATGSRVLVRSMQNIGRADRTAEQDTGSEITKRKQGLEGLFGDIFVDDFAHYVPVLGADHDEKVLQRGFITILPNGKIRGKNQHVLELEERAA